MQREQNKFKAQAGSGLAEILEACVGKVQEAKRRVEGKKRGQDNS